MKLSEERDAAAIQAALARLARYDDESIVHDRWIRQRYEGRYSASYVPARGEAVSTAWHGAGHAVAALAIGARFSSASILRGRDSAGRVHGISGGSGGVRDRRGREIAEQLRTGAYPSATTNSAPGSWAGRVTAVTPGASAGRSWRGSAQLRAQLWAQLRALPEAPPNAPRGAAASAS